MKQTTILAAFLAVTILTGPAYHAASPPTIVNYQGVLRDASDRPLDGNHEMVFRFFSAETAGDEILVDRHTTGDSAPVTVTGGLFSARLGAGAVQDGSGPGTYDSLADVFRDYTEVWLRVEVGGEVLDPRVQIVASAYALNAKHLDGRSAAGFINTTSTAQTKAGRLTIANAAAGQYGLEVYGPEGAFFQDSDQSGQAWIANGNWGVGGKGNVAGGSFEDLDDSGYAHVGIGDHGIQAYGNVAGGSFDDLDNTSTAQIAFDGFGVYAQGEDAGGYFDDLSQSGYAFVGYGDYGIQAYGNIAGGTFENPAGGSFMHAGRENYGIRAYGNLAGGTFDDLDGTGYAYVGYGDRGIHATGDEMGGYFADTNNSGFARAGSGNIGVYGEGTGAGGEFRESDTAAYAYVAYLDTGIRAWGNWAGGHFEHPATGTYAVIAYEGASTGGNGSKNFVQNHPYDRDKVIRYASLEGDEVGTYTRGRARLVAGEARVKLGETFKWVTNPDIGLTVSVTPRGECLGLYVASATTSEIIVRELGGGASDVVFDYVVYGLRIGFEESSVVEEKAIEALIPSMREYRERYEQHPELRRFTALERFQRMVSDTEGIDVQDFSRAEALVATIQEYDPEIHGPTNSLLGHGPVASVDGRDVEADAQSLDPEAPRDEDDPEASERAAPSVSTEFATVAGPALTTGTEYRAAQPSNAAMMPVSHPVDAADLLVFDPERRGLLRAADSISDPAVAGIAVASSSPLETGRSDGGWQAPVAVGGFVSCKVDAGYGAIRPGDLLTTSPTPGHAMRAVKLVPGTVIGKAAESLDTGTGTIRILVMPR